MNGPFQAKAEQVLMDHALRPSMAKGVERCICGASWIGEPGAHRKHVVFELWGTLGASTRREVGYLDEDGQVHLLGLHVPRDRPLTEMRRTVTTLRMESEWTPTEIPVVNTGSMFVAARQAPGC